MRSRSNDLLLLAGKTLTLIAQGAMAIAGAAVIVGLVAVAFFADSIDTGLRAEYGPATTGIPVVALLTMLAIAFVIVLLMFLFFAKLRGIIDTVGDGDPFVPENADRLNAMGWIQIGIHLIALPLGAAAAGVVNWASQFDDVEVEGSFGFDLSAVLLILVLFILARVFRQGAAMRADLEGTV